MVKKLKTFNLEEEVYKQFSDHCKSNGISMSKRIENFLKEEVSKLSGHQKPESPKEDSHPMHKYC